MTQNTELNNMKPDKKDKSSDDSNPLCDVVPNSIPSKAPPHSHTPPPAQSFWKQALHLTACSLAIYITFIGYGVIQEKIYTGQYYDGERFNHSLFLVFLQCIGNAAFALIAGLFAARRPVDEVKVPPTAYMMMSFSYIGAMFSSNLALSYMSYPAQALAKSCKMIPVMLARIVLMGQKYSMREYFQVVCITAGIGVFMMFEAGGKTSHKETSYLGLGLCIFSLILDGYTGPAQEKLNKQYKLTMSTMMFYLNFWAIIMVAVGLLVTGQMMSGVEFFFYKNPTLLTYATIFSLLSALGQASILYTLLAFNSLVVVTVTTTRKFFTILFSVVLYGHFLTGAQWIGVLLVFAGLSADIYAKYADRHQHKHKAHGK